jgi:hypothetical protein
MRRRSALPTRVLLAHRVELGAGVGCRLDSVAKVLALSKLEINLRNRARIALEPTRNAGLADLDKIAMPNALTEKSSSSSTASTARSR